MENHADFITSQAGQTVVSYGSAAQQAWGSFFVITDVFLIPQEETHYENLSQKLLPADGRCLLHRRAGCLRLQLFVYCFVQRGIRFCGGIQGSP